MQLVYGCLFIFVDESTIEIFNLRTTENTDRVQMFMNLDGKNDIILLASR